MKILITGAQGFIGKNLSAHLSALGLGELLLYDRATPQETLWQYARECDFVFHLAGVNRPQHESEFEDNHAFTARLLSLLARSGKKAPIVFSSSVQAQRDNPYGRSKRSAEALVRAYAGETGAQAYIFRLPGVFGKWCRPGYNSVVATFCHNIARGLPVRIDDEGALLELVYIDDVLRTFVQALGGDLKSQEDGFFHVAPLYTTTVGQLAADIEWIHTMRPGLYVADMGNPWLSRLYSTYLTYLPKDHLSYSLLSHSDQRGSFAECLKSTGGGQVSVNVTKPGMRKGGHWHHTKTEKFIVVAGSGIVRFQAVDGGEILTYPVDGNHPEVIDVPPGYTHDITNTGESDMIALIWASEVYDPQNPDTFAAAILEEVE